MLPVLAALLVAQPAYAKAQLVAEVSTVQPGVPFLAAVVIDTEPEWHVYWKNPGDSGMPTSIEWKLPAGWKADPLEFPTPKSFVSGGIVGYGYEGEAMFLARITPPKDAKTAPLKADVRWLVCKEACLPGSANVAVSLPVGPAKASATWASRLKEAESKVPRAAKDWSFKAAETKDGYELTALVPAGVVVKGEPEFLPFDSTVAAHDAPQKVNLGEGKITLAFRKSPYATAKPKTLKGLLVAPLGKRWPNGLDAIVVEAPIASGG
ncbi:MAG TPA: protein-disulfide reductase DsbD domain-containing protein [Fimbriimonas sp.]